MKRSLPLAALALFVLFLGCGSESDVVNATDDADGGPVVSGSTDGAATPETDASPATDATVATDASATHDAGNGDATLATDAASVANGPPIVAPANQWTWVPFDDAFCANGSSTGIGVNLSSTGSRVLIYMEGGGACWSELTCYTLNTATNFTSGYSQSNFASESTSTTYLAEPNSFFDRTAAANPFKDYSFVYVPYCTGDLHGGNNVVQYGTNTAKHVGFANMTAYLNRLVPTFPSADRVILAGSSAGGFGAVLNWWQTQQFFGKTRVDMIDDSGTPMPPDISSQGNGQQPIQYTQWNLAATLPPGCTTCSTNLASIFGFYAKAFPDHRGALLSYKSDSVLPSYFGISAAQFTTGLEEDITTEFAPNPNLAYFVNDASGHVLAFTPTLTTKGVTLLTFVTQMVTDDNAWAGVQP